MKCNTWFVLLLVTMPLFVLFTGLTAAAGMRTPAMWAAMAVVAASGAVAFRLAWRSWPGRDA